MKKKKISLVIIIFGFSILLFGQNPAWTDYYNRQNMYPENEFLVGFVSGMDILENNAEKQKSVYESMAKDRLVQSIQVEIETNTSMSIANVNGSSDEEFLSKSISFSKANVNGLSIKSYYDRKKKEVYAIAFVNRKELAYYYYNLINTGENDIEQKLKEGRQYIKKGDKENALKSFYETMPVLMKIDEARALLIALDRKMYADINMDKINSLKLEIIEEKNSLLAPNNLSMSESAYFMAYGLFLQLGNINTPILLNNFGYENTELASSFTEIWNREFAAALILAGKYEVVDEKKSTANQLVAYGNYWEEGGFLKINASVSQNGELLAVSKGSIPLAWLNSENIDYTPEQIELMKTLGTYKLKVVKAPETIKLGKASTESIKIQIVNNVNENGVSGIPVSYYEQKTDNIVCGDQTNETGIAECFLPAFQTENPIVTLSARINLADYLNISRNSVYYAIATRQNPVIPVSINLLTEKLTVFVQSTELIQGKSMGILTLEPIVKNSLAEKGYNFVDNEKDADFIIHIDANTTTGSKYQGIYFAFLDANVSIVDADSGEEIYKTHLDQVKGGGSDYKKAGKKAYTIGAKKLKENIVSTFLSK